MVWKPIQFEFDSDIPDFESSEIFLAVSDVLQQNPQFLKILIAGHTDSVGPAVYNKDLSQRRVEAVRDILCLYGVEKNRLDAVGYGEEKPLVPNNTVKNRAINRRVEFIITEVAEVK